MNIMHVPRGWHAHIAGDFFTRRSQETRLDLKQHCLRLSILHEKNMEFGAINTCAFLYVIFFLGKNNFIVPDYDVHSP